MEIDVETLSLGAAQLDMQRQQFDKLDQIAMLVSNANDNKTLAPDSAATKEIADLLGATERAHEGVQIGSYPFFREGRTGANFVIRSTDQAVLDACVTDLSAALTEGGWPPVPGGI